MPDILTLVCRGCQETHKPSVPNDYYGSHDPGVVIITSITFALGMPEEAHPREYVMLSYFLNV